jgi:hypothetical protein
MDMLHARTVVSNHPKGTHVAMGMKVMCAAIRACNVLLGNSKLNTLLLVRRCLKQASRFIFFMERVYTVHYTVHQMFWPIETDREEGNGTGAAAN